MKKTKFSDEKIAYVLRQVEAGTTAVQVCREHGISEQTFYRWKKRFAGIGCPLGGWAKCGVYANLKKRTPGSNNWSPT